MVGVKFKDSRSLMDRMLVVVLEDENKAYEAKSALLQLDSEGSISVYAYAVVAKNANGTATVKQSEDFGPLGTLAGTSLESLVGLLGGPTGLAIGAAVRLAAGATVDLNNARIGADFIEELTEVWLPWRVAVLAEVSEGWTTPVDTRMEMIGGTVLRRALSEVKDRVDLEDVAAIRADMAQLKAEQVRVHADRKAKLQEKINRLDFKLRAQFQKAKDRRQAAQREAQAKVHVLKAKAASAKVTASSECELEEKRTA